jgi:hypothetical protein
MLSVSGLYTVNDRMTNAYEGARRMRTDWTNRNTRRMSVSAPLCPPKIPHELTWDRNRAAGSRTEPHSLFQHQDYSVA